ncbi:hypothetical protein ACFLVN_00650 [Chloroflexota bacterium]
MDNQEGPPLWIMVLVAGIISGVLAFAGAIVAVILAVSWLQ